MYSLIIFDWDGTLMDSVGHIVASMQAAITEQCLPLLSAAAIRNIIGLGLPEAVQALYPELPLAQRKILCESYSRHFVAGNTAKLELFPQAEMLLRELNSEGYRLAVATGKTRKGLNRLLANNDWHSYFHATRCADETQSKPHPQMLHELLEQLDCHPRHALMVGDTEYDLQMANNAGVDSIGVSYGVHAVDRLAKHEPRAIIDQLIELKQWLTSNSPQFQ